MLPCASQGGGDYARGGSGGSFLFTAALFVGGCVLLYLL
jgi:hypothetical protein